MLASFHNCIWAALSLFLLVHIIAGRLCFSYKHKSKHYTLFAITYIGCATTSIYASFYKAAPHGVCALAASACLAYGLLLFTSALWTTRNRPLTAALSDDTPEVLLETGPWAHVRHPLYAAYLSCFAGLGILSCAPFALGCAGLMAWVFARAARREEVKFARSALKNAYAAYRARTGAFFLHL